MRSSIHQAVLVFREITLEPGGCSSADSVWDMWKLTDSLVPEYIGIVLDLCFLSSDCLMKWGLLLFLMGKQPLKN